MQTDNFSSMSIKSVVVCILSVSLFFACTRFKKETYMTSEDGLAYLFRERSGVSKKPQHGDRLLLRVAYYNSKDSLLFDSREISHTFIQLFDAPIDTVPSILHAYAMMNEGDSLSCKIDATYFFAAYKTHALPPGISQGDMLRFEIRLVRIYDQEDFQIEAERIVEELCEQEQLILQEYIQSQYPDQKPTASGMYYIEKRNGEGAQPGKNSDVLIHYSASFLDGQLIYSTAQSNKPLAFNTADEFVWPGLCEGVQYMKNGGLATMILPSELAAGKEGEKPIPPCKSIILRVQLLEVK
jgi:FKBP-type peptidyl-prolyl cis-trans isomerase FkpA